MVGVVGVDAGVVGVDAGVDGMDAGVDGPAAGAPGVVDEFPGDVVAPPLPCPTASPGSVVAAAFAAALARAAGCSSHWQVSTESWSAASCRGGAALELPTHPGSPELFTNGASATHIRGDSTGASGLDPTSLVLSPRRPVAPLPTPSPWRVGPPLPRWPPWARPTSHHGGDLRPASRGQSWRHPERRRFAIADVVALQCRNLGQRVPIPRNRWRPGPTADRWPTACGPWARHGRTARSALGAPVRGSRRSGHVKVVGRHRICRGHPESDAAWASPDPQGDRQGADPSHIWIHASGLPPIWALRRAGPDRNELCRIKIRPVP